MRAVITHECLMCNVADVMELEWLFDWQSGLIERELQDYYSATVAEAGLPPESLSDEMVRVFIGLKVDEALRGLCLANRPEGTKVH